MIDKNKILIIDLYFSCTRLMERALSNSKNSYKKTVSTISEAWFLIEKESFDLIITDTLPVDGDGLELLPN